MYNEDGSKYEGKGEGDMFFSIMGEYMNILDGLKGTPMSDIINELVTSPLNHTFGNYSKSKGSKGNYAIKTKEGSYTYFDPLNWESSEGEIRHPIIGLSHEMTHDYDISKGYDPNESMRAQPGLPFSEIKAINVENTVRKQLGTQYGRIYSSDPRKTYFKKQIDPKYLNKKYADINNFYGY